MCFYKWKAWYKLLSSSGLKQICAHFYHPPDILLRDTKYCHWAPNIVSSMLAILWKATKREFIFLKRKINLHVLPIAKALGYMIWLMTSEKSITTFLHVSSPWWCTHVPISPSIETHLAVVRGLPTKKFLPKCFNEKSSTERRSYSRQTNRSSQECQVLFHHLIRQD